MAQYEPGAEPLDESAAEPVGGPGVDRSPAPFHGWRVVAGSFIMLMASSGLGFYGLSVYLATLNRERGFSVSGMSGATAVFFLASGAVGPLLARFVRRHDPRPIMVLGGLLAAGSIVGLGRVTHLWQVYIDYFFFGTGFACTGLVVVNSVVTRWFDRRRSIALSISSTGLSVGGIVILPVAKHLIDSRGLHGATPWIALVYLIGALPIPLLLIRPDPARIGQRPDGDAARVEHGVIVAHQASGVSLSTAVKTVSYWAITLGFLLAMSAQVGGIAQLVKVATERSSRGTASLAVSVLAACSVVGRLAGGTMLARRGPKASPPFAMICIVVQAFGLAAIGLAHGRTAILGAAVLFGLMVGNVLLLHPLLLVEAFGVLDYARIYARSSLVLSLGFAFGPFLLGWLRDHAGGYRSSYLVASGLSIAGVVVFTLGTRLATARGLAAATADA